MLPTVLATDCPLPTDLLGPAVFEALEVESVHHPKIPLHVLRTVLRAVLPTDCFATDGPVVVEALETEDVQHPHRGLHFFPVTLDVRVDRRHQPVEKLPVKRLGKGVSRIVRLELPGRDEVEVVYKEGGNEVKNGVTVKSK